LLITSKEKVQKPFVNVTGERVYEMVGKPARLGGATKHSFGYAVIPPNCSSRLHYHPQAEETYYMLKGEGRLVIDGVEHNVRPGDAILISPPEKHQIFNEGGEDLEFVVVCAPAWEPDNSVFLDNPTTGKPIVRNSERGPGSQ
jgi:mannose-6-phosphate isomerase-like protein (cupin superfamily)